MNIASVFQGLASLSWLVAVGALGFAVYRGARGGKFGGGAAVVIGAVVAAVVLTTVAAGLVFVEPDQRGVVISALEAKGYRDDILQPGLRWIVPFVERVQVYSISRQTYTMSVAPTEGQLEGDDSVRARTKDGQEVFIDASVIYAIDPIQVVTLHINWQGRFEESVVRPQARGIIRDTASQYGVEEIVSSKRVEMEQLITDALTEKLQQNELVLVDFVLRDIHFSEEYAAAVEQKQIAEQLAQQAAFVVQQRQQEAEQARQVAQGQADAAVIAAKGAAEARIVNAEAEARALALIAEQLQNNSSLLTYTYIQKLAPNVQVMYLPSGTPLLLPAPTAGGGATTP